MVGPAVEFVFAILLVIDGVVPELVILVVLLVHQGFLVAVDGVEDGEVWAGLHGVLINSIILFR